MNGGRKGGRRRKEGRMKKTTMVSFREAFVVMGMEVKAKKKLLLMEDLDFKGFRRESISRFRVWHYVAQVMLDKYQKREETDGKHLPRSLVPSSYPRRPRSARRRNPARWYSWSEDVGESPTRAEEEAASKKPRREEEDHLAGPSASQRPRRDPEPFHPEDMPRELRDWIESRLRGTGFLPVCQKMLTTTDVSPHHRRLLIPMDRMVSLHFLTEDERARVELPSTKGDERGVEVGVMSRTLKLRKLSFRKWVMNKSGGHAATVMYVLTKSDWVEVVKDNRLTAGEMIQIWSYRVDGQLHMAVVVVNRAVQPREGGN